MTQLCLHLIDLGTLILQLELSLIFLGICLADSYLKVLDLSLASFKLRLNLLILFIDLVELSLSVI